MRELNILAQQLYNEVLNLEIAYSKLYNAYITDNIFGMRTAIVNYKSNFPLLSLQTQTECKNVFYENGVFLFRTDVPIEKLTLKELKMNTKGCMNTALDELSRLNYYQSNCTYATEVLYKPQQRFEPQQVVYPGDKGNLTVSDLLSVSKYAVKVAQAVSPDNENYDKANAVISVFQGIDAVLNNKPEDKPINKMLHLVNDFLAGVVKSCADKKEEKEGVIVSSTLVDLAIDFLCKK